MNLFTRALTLSSLLGCSAVLLACGDDFATEEPTARIDLRTTLGVADADPIAVTVSPDGTQRFVFDRSVGIVELGVGNTAEMVMPITAIPDPGVPVRLPYTDLVSLGDDKFALTAIGDGFLLDTAAESMALHFCYEPGFIPEDFVQRTDAVTYDPILDKIIAQPQTFNENDEAVSSDVGYYNRENGFDEQWFPLNVEFAAGGMAVDKDGELFLGEGALLYRYNKAANRVDLVSNLARFGVSSIDGLAFTKAGALLVVDGTSDELLEIGAEQL